MQARERMHAAAAEAPSAITRPAWAEVERFLVAGRARARADDGIDPARRDRIVTHYTDALEAGRAPGPAMWTAWQAFADMHRRLDLAAHLRAGRAAPVPASPTPITDDQIVAIARPSMCIV